MYSFDMHCFLTPGLFTVDINLITTPLKHQYSKLYEVKTPFSTLNSNIYILYIILYLLQIKGEILFQNKQSHLISIFWDGSSLSIHKWIKINISFHIKHTYVFHYLLIIHASINIKRNALFDFSAIQNTSGVDCSATSLLFT